VRREEDEAVGNAKETQERRAALRRSDTPKTRQKAASLDDP
jgi:hypothetical protein